MTTELERIFSRAKAEPKIRFTALAHHLSVEFLSGIWRLLNKKGTAGVDGVSRKAYEENLYGNLERLVAEMKAGYYHAPPVRRVYIPKAGNPQKRRPLGIPTVEDRLLQAAVAQILGAVYEADFLDCAYGFRPGRTAHQAVAELRREVTFGKVQWIYEADIRGFFDHLDHGWLMRMLEQRVADPWILRPIRKWLKAGIFERGAITEPTEGSPQGGPISPMLANVYLHYALDLWFERMVRPRCRGEAKPIRFADDFLVLFSNEADARAFADVLPKRMAKFGLNLAEEKTRLIPFGRTSWRPGESHPHHFDFLGFRHHLGRDRKGRMAVIRIPCPKSVRKFLAGVKEWLRRHRHEPGWLQSALLVAKLRGFYQYFALWHTTRKLEAVRKEVEKYWVRSLNGRSQKGKKAWGEWNLKPWFRLPKPRMLHRTV